MKSALTITRDNTAEFRKGLKALTATAVLVGVPAQNAERAPEPGEKETINNAQIAYLMENGSPAQNIPARPHFEPALKDIQPKITAVFEKAAKGVMDVGGAMVDQALGRVGLMAQSAIRAKITSGGFAPLAPATIEARMRQRGAKTRRKSEKTYLDMVASGVSPAEAQATAGIKPLINTGAYLASITYVLRKKGE